MWTKIFIIDAVLKRKLFECLKVAIFLLINLKKWERSGNFFKKLFRKQSNAFEFEHKYLIQNKIW